MKMNRHYEKLLQNLNIVKWELKGRNDLTLNLCIKYIQDAIFDASRLHHDLVILEGIAASRDAVATPDDWSED
jgi:hypothetical protein